MQKPIRHHNIEAFCPFDKENKNSLVLQHQGGQLPGHLPLGWLDTKNTA